MRIRPSGPVTTKPSGRALDHLAAGVDLALAATTAPASASSGSRRTRNSEAFSCRNRDAETSSSRRPSAKRARTFVGPAGGSARRPAAPARRRQALGVEAFRERPADQPLAARPSSWPAAGLASTTLWRGRVDDQHRLGGDLEQQPVAGLDVAQARSSRAPSTAGRRPAAAAAPPSRAGRGRPPRGGRPCRPARRVEHRQIGAARASGWLTCRQRGGARRGGLGEQRLDLGPALDRDRLDPGPAQPSRVPIRPTAPRCRRPGRGSRPCCRGSARCRWWRRSASPRPRRRGRPATLSGRGSAVTRGVALHREASSSLDTLRHRSGLPRRRTAPDGRRTGQRRNA